MGVGDFGPKSGAMPPKMGRLAIVNLPPIRNNYRSHKMDARPDMPVVGIGPPPNCFSLPSKICSESSRNHLSADPPRGCERGRRES